MLCRGCQSPYAFTRCLHVQFSCQPRWGSQCNSTLSAPPSLLFIGYKCSYQEVKRPGGAWSWPLPSSDEIKKLVELYFQTSIRLHVSYSDYFSNSASYFHAHSAGSSHQIFHSNRKSHQSTLLYSCLVALGDKTVAGTDRDCSCCSCLAGCCPVSCYHVCLPLYDWRALRLTMTRPAFVGQFHTTRLELLNHPFSIIMYNLPICP